MKKLMAIVTLMSVLFASYAAVAEVKATATPSPETALEQVGQLVEPGETAASAALPTPKPEGLIETTTSRLKFVNASRYLRTRKVTYYDNDYANNFDEYLLQPFDSKVPVEYFVMDDEGYLALAPLVLDITDAMRERLYGEDVGSTAMYYGQYCEQVMNIRRKLVQVAKDTGKRDDNGNVVYKRKWLDEGLIGTSSQGEGYYETGKTSYTTGVYGYSGIHEGVDFVYEKGAPLHAILGGVVTRAGDSNGTVAIYSEDLDITVLYLHCQDIKVKKNQTVIASDIIGYEGGKGITAGIYNTADYKSQGLKHVSTSHYVHVEVRKGRHTTSNKYRNTILESDCPYEYMRQALNIQDSGRQPVSKAAVTEAERMREEAEAQAKAEEEAAAAWLTETPEPEIEVVEESAAPGYGFSETAEEPAAEATEEPAEEPTAAPEATLPPAA